MLGEPLTAFVLDNPEHIERGRCRGFTGLAEVANINAVGLLLAAGYTHEQAHTELCDQAERSVSTIPTPRPSRPHQRPTLGFHPRPL